MSRNGDIRGFFTAVGTKRSQPPSSPLPQPPAPQPGPSQPIADLQLSSSPRTPRKPASKVLSRDDVIKGSSEDDDDDDSDGSLESLSALIRPNGPAPYERGPNILSTPKAKRIASTAHKSPLTLQPKKHKFDMKSLINHSRQHERTDESARRAEDLMKGGEDEDDDSSSAAGDLPRPLHQSAKDLLNSDEEEAKGEKLVRAIHRTKVVNSRRKCYFFHLEQPLFKPPRCPFPQKKAKGPWSCLADSNTRAQAFIHGLPYTIASLGSALPDELYLWVLDEVCVEKNALLRIQYSNLLSLYGDNTRRLVNDMRLYSMLERIGGPKYAREHSKFESFPELEEPYPDRDWTGLVTFLQVLRGLAPHLSTASTISAIQLLLRMSLDPVVSTTVRNEHFDAIHALVSTLPSSGSRWNTACETICSYLYENIEDTTFRLIPISLLPRSSPQLIDLGRRLAAESLFRAPGLGKGSPDDTLTAARLRKRLSEPDFRTTHDTDFEALKALIALLDVVIGDAGFLTRSSSAYSPPSTNTTTTSKKTHTPPLLPHPPTSTHLKPPQSQPPSRPSPTNKQQQQQQHHHHHQPESNPALDQEIDDLTLTLKTIHDRIHDSAVLSRKEAKTALDVLGKRLEYAVRTRRKAKISIFDRGGAGVDPMREEKERVAGQRQRAFMDGWAGNGGGGSSGGGGVRNYCIIPFYDKN
ncbi:hypothetical protein F4778DRAFT_774491 [Xylariomycetidae sp. FL2044]|nr:hypothetical protein F4778DRAFT_774491 [Xylariomycetidae sp. FL2044]